jgi:hypothetical protein
VACVLCPLLKKFYGLWSYKTNRLYDASAHRSTWHNDRARSHSKAFQNDKSHEARNGRIELDGMEGVVTSVLESHKVDRTREWTKKNNVISRSRVGNESEEELAGQAKVIVIHQTVEIRSQEREAGQKRRCTNSIDSEN